MVNFFWKFLALTLVLIGGREVEKAFALSRGYSGGWKKTFQNCWRVWRKKAFITVKPSGTVGLMRNTIDGIHPSYNKGEPFKCRE